MEAVSSRRLEQHFQRIKQPKPTVQLLNNTKGMMEKIKHTTAFGMNHSFRNPLPIKMRHFIQEDDIL